MLVLSRKSKEAVVIGAADDMQELVRVTVLEVRRGTVKLGFQADDDVAVYREEVWERVRSESRTPVPTPVAELPKYRVPYID
jgi:carbon storage regulator CsrA